MLGQLTKQHSEPFGADNGHFLFEGRHSSLSTINGETQQFNFDTSVKNESVFTSQQKINMKEILKGQVTQLTNRKNSNYKPFIEDESMSFINSNNSIQAIKLTPNSFITENPFPEEIELATETSELLFKKKFFVGVKNHQKNFPGVSPSNTINFGVDSKSGFNSIEHHLGGSIEKIGSDFNKVKSGENVFIREDNFNSKSHKNKMLGKKLQPTRITTDALATKNEPDQRAIKPGGGTQLMRDNKSQSNMRNFAQLSQESAQKDMRGANVNTMEKKNSYQKLKESPRMFLLSSQELDLRKSEVIDQRNSLSRNMNNNIKHKSTKSEAIMNMPTSTKSMTGSGISAFNTFKRENSKKFGFSVANASPKEMTTQNTGLTAQRGEGSYDVSERQTIVEKIPGVSQTTRINSDKMLQKV